jgi:hypothetical protein
MTNRFRSSEINIKIEKARGLCPKKKAEEREEISFKEAINSRKIRRVAHIVRKGT